MRSVANVGHECIDHPSRFSGRLGSPRLTAKCAFVRNFLRSRKNANLIESADIRRESAVDAEHFAVYDLHVGEREIIAKKCRPDENGKWEGAPRRG
jgi:hypothetical protein